MKMTYTIEYELTHPDATIRIKRADSDDYTPTPTQIERGLTDVEWEIRMIFACRTDYTLTFQQIERGLTDNSYCVRREFAKRNDYTPTPEQIERGLTDEALDVRIQFALRTDYTPTSKQVERGLVDFESFRKRFSPTLHKHYDGIPDFAHVKIKEGLQLFDDQNARWKARQEHENKFVDASRKQAANGANPSATSKVE